MTEQDTVFNFVAIRSFYFILLESIEDILLWDILDKLIEHDMVLRL